MQLKNILRASLIAFLCLSFSSIFYAQERTGIIKGKITDEEGNPLPGVTVTVKGPAGAKRTVITNARGVFRFTSLRSGKHFVTAVLPGFKTQSKENILVRIGDTTTIDFMMGMSALEEELVAKSEKLIVKPKKPIAKIERDSVLNERLDEEIGEISIGKILFNPPEIMKVGVKERIEVRISQNVNEDLTERLRGKGFPRIEEIIVSTVMKVKLSGDDFKIESHSEEEQYIQSAGYTQWEWDATPLKSGNRLIRLSVAVSVYLDEFGEKTKSLPVLEKEIYVKVNMSFSFYNFIKEKWEWIVGTIIALIGIYLAYKKSKKRRKNHGS